MVGTWQSPWNIDVAMNWRFFDGTKNDNPTEMLETNLDAVNYVDLSGSWYLLDDSITVRLSVLNVFGEDPPIFSGAGPALGNGNTYPTVYDTSRTLIAGFKWHFQ